MAGLRLAVRLTPKASADRIGEWAEDGQGGRRLKIYVTEAPEDGKANKALIRLLAKKLKIAQSDVELISGHTDRNKILMLHGDADSLIAKLPAGSGTDD